MYALLLPLGVICAIAGLVSLGFGVPIKEFALGNTLIIVGTIGFVGGLTIVALASAVRHLSKIAHALESSPRPVARPRAGEPETAPGRERPAARPAPTRAAPPQQSDRPVASFPNPAAEPDPGHEPARRSPAPSRASDTVEDDGGEAPPTMPMHTRENHAPPRRHDDDVIADRAAADHEPVAREPAARDPLDRVAPSPVSRAQGADTPPRSSVTRPSAPKFTSPFDAVWPAEGRGETTRPAAQPAVSAPAAGERDSGSGLKPAEARPVSILKSGVIDSMAYTLYTDGSIEAQMPHGTMRFSSIEDLRIYLESNG